MNKRDRAKKSAVLFSYIQSIMKPEYKIYMWISCDNGFIFFGIKKRWLWGLIYYPIKTGIFGNIEQATNQIDQLKKAKRQVKEYNTKYE